MPGYFPPPPDYITTHEDVLGCFSEFSRVCQQCVKGSSKKLFQEMLTVFQGSFQVVSMVFEISFMGISWVFEQCLMYGCVKLCFVAYQSSQLPEQKKGLFLLYIRNIKVGGMGTHIF